MIWTADSALTVDSAIALADGYFPDTVVPTPPITTPRSRTLFARMVRRILIGRGARW